METNKVIAHPGLRFLAYLIDMTIGLILFLLPLIPVSTATEITVFLNAFLMFVLWLIMISLLHPLINGLLISTLGGTPGKLVTRTAILDETTGSKLSFMKALFRTYIGYTVSAVLFYLGYIWILVDAKKRGWHDLVSNTAVYSTGRLGIISGLITLAFLSVIAGNLLMSSVNGFKNNSGIILDVINDIKDATADGQSEGPSFTLPTIDSENPAPSPVDELDFFEDQQLNSI